MSKPALLSVAALLTLVACGTTNSLGTGASTGSSSSSASASSGSGGSAGTGGTGGATNLESYTVTWGPVTLMPGEENTQCVVKKLGNTAAMHVGSIHNVLNQGSHHLIVYKTNDTMEQPTPFACQPFSDLLHPEKGTPLMISQKHDDTLTLPKGVAFAIGAEQFVRLELHYINTGTTPLTVSATSTFVQMPESEVQNEAGFLFAGDPDINLQPMSMATLGPVYMPEPTMLAGSKYFGITGHEHHWGTDVTVATTTGQTGTDTPVYDVQNWLWSEPETVYLNPPVQVPSGGGFRFSCSWNNLSSDTVKFGESANDEMCFFWTYYYPDQGALVCAHTDQIPGGYNLCCPGPSICNQIFP